VNFRSTSLEDAPSRCFRRPEVTRRELNVTVSITWDGTYTCIQNAAGQRMHQHAYSMCLHVRVAHFDKV